MSRKWFQRAQDVSRMNRDVASQAEAEAGVNNEKIITPLRMKQGIGALDGVDFTTLSNVLVVDPSFDENTAGWGVKAFANLAVAVSSISANGVLIVANGDVGTDSFDVEYAMDIFLLPGATFRIPYCGIYADFGIYGHKNVIGTCSLNVVDSCTLTLIGADFGSSRIDIDEVSVTWLSGVKIARIKPTTAGATIQIDESAITTSLDFSGFSSHANSYVKNCTIDLLLSMPAGFAIYNTQIATLTTSIIDPLNHSNTVGGTTYREVVAVADLPAASSANQGATAMTSDGGTGGIPAMMVNLDGANWTVAYE